MQKTPHRAKDPVRGVFVAFSVAIFIAIFVIRFRFFIMTVLKTVFSFFIKCFKNVEI